MNRARRQRLTWVILVVLGISGAVAIALFALRQNINLFYSPSQVDRGQAPKNVLVRLGGLVKSGSVKHAQDRLQVSFVLTDQVHQVRVRYRGILPDLFREGQGIVAQGKINADGVFVAEQVLAKHDATYMPPEVKDALAVAKTKHKFR